MPNIYDNIDKHLVDALRAAMVDAAKLDVCVGYFNLRGWSSLAASVDKLDGPRAGLGEVGLRHAIAAHELPDFAECFGFNDFGAEFRNQVIKPAHAKKSSSISTMSYVSRT